MPRYTYLVVSLNDATVVGTNCAEEVQDFVYNEDYLIIITSSGQAVICGDPESPQKIGSVNAELEDPDEDDD